MKSKRLCAWLMSLTLLLALLPAAAYGAEGDIASIDGKGYASLQEAFDAVEPGTATKVVLEQSFVADSVITLAEGKEVTLDLNGKTITVTSGFTGRPICNNGTLTITGEGTMDTSASTTAYGSVDNYGTLVIENGTFTGYTYAGGAVIKNRPYGEVTIYDGWFGGTPTAVYNAGITKIYNGTFDGRSCSACNSDIWGYTIQSHMNDAGCVPELYFYNGTVIGVQGAFSTSAGTSEIHDGTFTTVGCDKHGVNSAWYALYVAGESGQVSTTVYGGTFTSASKYAAFIGNSNDGGDKQDAIATFKGGTFKSGRSDVAIYVDGTLGDLEITGGTYLLNNGSVATDAAQWMPEGYEQNEDGSVTHSHHYENGVCTVCGGVIEAEVPELDPSAPADEVQMGVDADGSQELNQAIAEVVDGITAGTSDAVSAETAEKVSDAIAVGADISAQLVIQAMDKMSQADAALAEKVLGDADTLAAYFDLSVLLKANGEVLGTVQELAQPVTVRMAVPAQLQAEGRTFFVLRIHDGKAEKLPVQAGDDQIFSFQTDRFSTYALGYTDKVSAPETGDAGQPALWAAVLALCALTGGAVWLNRKKIFG